MYNTSHYRVSVVITAYNAERYISRCIDSALTQTLGPVHVVVVDDGSSDGTSQVVATYGNNVELIRLPENRGPAIGRTTGLMKCTTEYVAFLDSDDYWRPTFVEKTLAFLDANPDVIAANTGYCGIDWNGKTYDKPILDEIDSACYGTCGAICPDFFRFWSKYKAVLTGTVMMRTGTALKTEGQRADLRLTQDLEFWGFLATFGRWGFIPNPLFVTDQKALTPNERLAKFKRRFMFFRDIEIENWARRIRPRLDVHSSIEAFDQFLGHIATTISWANAYTFQFRKSYLIAKEWNNRLDRGIGSVLRYGTWGGKVFWPLVCITLRLREIIKAYWGFPLTRSSRGAKSNG